MAKSTKSQNPEFLQKRRRAIVELAKRRGQGRRVTPTAAPLDPGAKGANVIASGYAVRAQSHN